MDRDLPRAKLMLQRAVHFEMGNMQELEGYLTKVQTKIKAEAGGDPDDTHRTSPKLAHSSSNLGRTSPNHRPVSPRMSPRLRASISGGAGASPFSLCGRATPRAGGGTSPRGGSPRRQSYTPRLGDSPGEVSLGARGRSSSVVSEVNATVGYLNGAEICSIKEGVSGRDSPSPRGRGKVSSYDDDFLDDGDLDRHGSSRGGRPVSPNSRRPSQRGFEIQDMIRGENTRAATTDRDFPEYGGGGGGSFRRQSSARRHVCCV